MSNKDKIQINIMSFGYKYGVPNEANFLQDVRFLPNPYYVDELKPKNGLSIDVQAYVLDSPVSVEFLSKLKDFMEFYAKEYFDSGKESMTIAIGCTGGKHRSVTVAELLCLHMKKCGFNTCVTHRDIGKDK